MTTHKEATQQGHTVTGLALEHPERAHQLAKLCLFVYVQRLENRRHRVYGHKVKNTMIKVRIAPEEMWGVETGAACEACDFSINVRSILRCQTSASRTRHCLTYPLLQVLLGGI